MADIMDSPDSSDLLSVCWADSSTHRRWLLAEGQRLLEHYAKARVPYEKPLRDRYHCLRQ